MSESSTQRSSAFVVEEPRPKHLDWPSALSATLRQEFDGASVEGIFPIRRGVQVRVAFGQPLAQDQVAPMVTAMASKATDLARRMRHLEEDTVLEEFERMERAFREGLTLLQQANSLVAGAKTAAELTVAATTLGQAVKFFAKAFLPSHIAALLP